LRKEISMRPFTRSSHMAGWRSPLLAFALATATATVLPVAAQADEMSAAPPNDTVQTSASGLQYVCTGIGESKFDPQWETFPLKLVVATVEGGYLADFTATIADGSGAPVFDAHCLAPWMLVNLPAGNYTATLTARGIHEKTVDVEIGSGQNEITVHFEGINEI
jgi:hypothetical protein